MTIRETLEDEVIEPQIIDLDLDKEDALLREAIGQSTRVRFHGEVVEFQHPSLWSTTALQAATSGDWIAWAQEVVEDPDQFAHFRDANLRVYQMEQIFKRLNRDGGAELGKSTPPRHSSRGTRKT